MIDQKRIVMTNEELHSLFFTIGNQPSQPMAIVDCSQQPLSIIYANQSFAQLTGYSIEELTNKPLSSLYGSKTSVEEIQQLEFHLSNQLAYETAIIHYQKDGTPFWNHIYALPINTSKKNEMQVSLILCKNQTKEMLEKMLHQIEHKVYVELGKDSALEEVLGHIAEHIENNYIQQIYCAIHILLPNGALKTVASPTIPPDLIHDIVGMEATPTTGFSENNVYLKDLAYVNPSCSSQQNNHIHKLLTTFNIRYCLTKPFFDHGQTMKGTFTIYIPENSQLKQLDLEFMKKLSPILALTNKHFEQKNLLKQLAYYDMNTGVPNYQYFCKQLAEWIHHGEEGVILLIQPGEYVSIVDMYGYKVGDQLIKQIIERIGQFAPKDCIIYGRFSNSYLILAKKYSAQEANSFIRKMIDCTARPFNINGREMFITLKIGASYFHREISIDECIRQVNIAITKSRKKIGTVVSYFEKETDEQIQRELNILNELTACLKKGELSVYLQPKVHLLTKEIIGFEALARWNSPVLGSVSPAEFISVAEQNGKIRDVDSKILEKVLKWQRQRKDYGFPLYPVSINVSPVHFYQDSFIDDFMSLARYYQIDPKYIKIELTENFELFDFDKAKDILLKLKEHGFESSIDDFGIGFSSLSYLQRLPFSEIKIDRTFIHGIHESGMHAIVHSIVQLAKSLNMHAVAEGIETEEQLRKLIEIGCHTGQGFYFHKPMPIEQAEKLITCK